MNFSHHNLFDKKGWVLLLLFLVNNGLVRLYQDST